MDGQLTGRLANVAPGAIGDPSVWVRLVRHHSFGADFLAPSAKAPFVWARVAGWFRWLRCSSCSSAELSTSLGQPSRRPFTGNPANPQLSECVLVRRRRTLQNFGAPAFGTIFVPDSPRVPDTRVGIDASASFQRTDAGIAGFVRFRRNPGSITALAGRKICIRFCSAGAPGRRRTGIQTSQDR